MGTQWPGMGRDLMELEVFRRSIMKSDEALKPFGLHLYDIIMNGDAATFENTHNSFVGIAAIQVRISKDFHLLCGMIKGGLVREVSLPCLVKGLLANVLIWLVIYHLLPPKCPDNTKLISLIHITLF